MQVTIHPRLIQMVGRKLYESDPLVILTRELLQNSHDACRRRNDPRLLKAQNESLIAMGLQPLEPVSPRITIQITAGEEEDETIIVCTDNGIGMTPHQLENNFLSLGNVKDLEQDFQTGGFGIAKAAILSSEWWKAETLDWIFTRDDLFADGDPRQDSRVDGTVITCKLKSKAYFNNVEAALRCIYLSDIPGVEINVIVERKSGVGVHDKDVDMLFDKNKVLLHTCDDWSAWGMEPFKANEGSFYSNKISGYNVVRLNGLVQFTFNSWNNRDTNLFFDITPKGAPGDAEYPFDLSREKLVNMDIKQEIMDMIDSHNSNQNKSSDMVNKPVLVIEEIKRIVGILLKGTRKSRYEENTTRAFMGNKTPAEVIMSAVSRSRLENQVDQKQTGKPDVIFVRYNGSKETARRHAKLLRAWTSILEIVAEDGEEFGVGLTGDESAQASRMSHGDNDQVYYVMNPDTMDKGLSPQAQILYMWHIACHEAAHRYEHNHTERFTTMHAVVAADTVEQIYSGLSKLADLLR